MKENIDRAADDGKTTRTHVDDDEVSIATESGSEGPFLGSGQYADPPRYRLPRGPPFGYQRRAAVAVSGYLVSPAGGECEKGTGERDSRQKREGETRGERSERGAN